MSLKKVGSLGELGIGMDLMEETALRQRSKEWSFFYDTEGSILRVTCRGPCEDHKRKLDM